LVNSGISQFSARAVRTVNSTACSLMTGSVPGNPRHTGQTRVLGGAEAYCALHVQNILLAVSSCAWTSKPITTS
jgi:hypothetical protein